MSSTSHCASRWATCSTPPTRRRATRRLSTALACRTPRSTRRSRTSRLRLRGHRRELRDLDRRVDPLEQLVELGLHLPLGVCGETAIAEANRDRVDRLVAGRIDHLDGEDPVLAF